MNKVTNLKDLYQKILITGEVYEEFGGNLPEWIVIYKVKDHQKQKDLEKYLDKGEASSIALALKNENSTLIIDELKGRNAARSLNIDIIGTIGILILAHKKGLINDLMSIILRMVNRGFRLSGDIIEKLIEKYGKN